MSYGAQSAHTSTTFAVQPDIVTNVAGSQTIALKSGVSDVNGMRYDNINGQDLNFLSFNLVPPSDNAVLDPKVQLHATCRFVLKKVTGTWASIAEAFPSHKAGLAQFPIAKIMSQLTVTINGKSIERQPNIYHHALSLFEPLKSPEYISEFGTPDFTTSIGELEGVALGPSPRNSVANYGWHGEYGTRRHHRISVNLCTDETGNNTTGSASSYARILVLIRMTLPISLFNCTGEKPGIPNIKSMTINATCDTSRAAEMLSITPDVDVERVFLYPTTVPAIYATWKTPQEYVISNMPKKSIHPFTAIPSWYDCLPTSVGRDYATVANVGPISMTRVPSKIYIFAQKDLSTYTTAEKMSHGTTGLDVMSITMNYNGVSHHLANMAGYDLWDMSAKNGFIHDYYTSVYCTGMVVCIDLAKDISLRKLFVGEAANDNLYLSIQAANRGPACHFIVRVVPVYDHILTLDSDGSATITESFSFTDEEKRSMARSLARSLQSRSTVVGGFFGTIFNGIKSLFGGSYVTAGGTPDLVMVRGEGMKSGGTVIAGAIPYTDDSEDEDEDDDDPYLRL